MTLAVAAGEIWLADRGGEVRQPVVVLSDRRFHRLAERAVVAPIVAGDPGPRPPWQIAIADERTIAVHQLGTMPVERLLERLGSVGARELQLAHRAMRAITS